MRILHTSDWHLGHALHDVDRTWEHEAFLEWLVATVQAEEVDALLVAGDVFDTANPSATAQELWYGFLARALRARPGLQVVAIAGNHDSAARLQAPEALLKAFRIHVVGTLPRTADGAFDPDGVRIVLHDREDRPGAVVVALPFLRPGDLPDVEAEDPLVAGVRELHARACAAAAGTGLPLIVMGHGYLAGGQLSELSERKVLGGNQHALPVDVFPPGVAYAALGHLHRPQALDGGRLRYSGSPLPLSMAERHYAHAVTLLDLAGDAATARQVPVPRAVDLRRIPDRDALPLPELLAALAALEVRPEPVDPRQPKPFLEVAVRLEAPVPDLRVQLEKALEGRGWRLVKITPQTAGTGRALADAVADAGLRDLDLEEVFTLKWRQDYGTEPGADHLAALHELRDAAGQAGAR